ncbi:MAG: ABC transporter substrate-binding protein [Smithella sp.]|jgi:ABC-type branched-subunit amino acid transport system substrate-binding protein|nr:ABC transporter substrate-binding protein [Smithella sp.]
MNNYRLSAVLSFVFLLALLAGCVKGPFVAEKHAEVSDVKIVERAAEPAQAGPPEETAEPGEPSVMVPLPVLADRQAIGCIFPLSGRFADEGRKALDAALLAAQIFSHYSSSPWKIAVADGGEDAGGIKQAVAYLADQAKVMAIVAVCGASDAVAAAAEAQRRQVPLILISSKEGVTQTGEYVFQHFLTPSQQAEALARYALDTLNVAIFTILYPEDDYGEEMLGLFGSEVGKIGGKLLRSVSYNKSQTDFTAQIQKLTANKMVRPGKTYATRQEAKEHEPLDFEAIFIPDSAFRVKMITSQLAFYSVRGVKLLGTSLWHSPELLKKGGEYLNGAFFTDSFYVNGFLPETNDFVDAYYAAYGREPAGMEALTYDTTRLVIRVLESSAVGSRADFIRSLQAVTGFCGATGCISFRDSRVAYKNAFILKVENGKLVQVK